MNTPIKRLACGLAAILLLAEGLPAGFGATNYVTQGQSIQDAVTAASPGDTIIIFGGSYTESVTVNKPLSLLRLAGQTVFITGNLTFQGIASPTNAPLIISNLKIGGDTSKKLIVNNCTNVLVCNVDMSAGGGISLNGSSKVQVNLCQMNSGDGFRCSASDVWVGNSIINSMDMSSSEVTVSRVTVDDFVRMNNTGATSCALNVLQCTITNNLVQVQGGFGRILYSQLQRFYETSSADCVILGNRISTDKQQDSSIILEGGGKALVRNNDIAHPAGGWHGEYGSLGNAIRIDNCETTIVNNYVHDLANAYHEESDDDREGVYVANNPKKVQISSNIFWGTRRPVYAPYDNVTYRYNDDVEGLNRHAGGVIAEAIIAQDPQFANKTDADYHLSPGSPCINAGPPQPWFNDRDGTRNDMGLFGGAAYDPDGKTTDKPITFLIQAAPLTVIKGVHTNLTISGGGMVIGK